MTWKAAIAIYLVCPIGTVVLTIGQMFIALAKAIGESVEDWV